MASLLSGVRHMVACKAIALTILQLVLLSMRGGIHAYSYSMKPASPCTWESGRMDDKERVIISLDILSKVR